MRPLPWPLKGLLVDFDDTLVPADDAASPVITSVCDEVSAACGVDPHVFRSTLFSFAESVFPSTPIRVVANEFFDGSIGFPAHAHELLWEDKPPFDALAPGLDEFRVTVWSEACNSLGLDDLIDPRAMAGRLVAEIAARRTPYPDVEPAIIDLSRRFKLAILTNGQPEVQAAKVERSGLARYFDHVVFSSQHGSKPRPASYRIALQLLNCEPAEVATVGDNLHRDISGAQTLGIYSVWLNRHHQPNETDILPDAEIRSLNQLQGVLVAEED